MILAAVWMVLGWMIFVVLTDIVLFVWACRKGQFKNIEAAKFKMLEDREHEPWPDCKGGKK